MLLQAARDGTLDEATLALVRARSACHLHSRDVHGRSLLHWLAARNDVALVDATLADGALATVLLNSVDDFGLPHRDYFFIIVFIIMCVYFDRHEIIL